MAQPLELKKTLNLPKTDFPMKAGLPQNEPRQLEAWHNGNIYEGILEARKGKPLFVLHDGPPYPTGEIHLGTGLNKILKDLVVKTKSMAGHYAPYVPGWDCHGLPIETQVEKELGGKGKVPPAEFRKLCRQFALRYVEQHKKDFKRLGIFGRWNDPYLTMSHEYEATIAGAFLDFMEKGYVYRGRKPVYWCIYDSTALAEAEVEYEDHTSPSIWVKFAVVVGHRGDIAGLGSDVSAVIWTTTPWTIPHNRALAFHPDFEYAVVDTEKGALLLASDRIAALQAECGIKEARVRATFKGRDFDGMKFQHPFLPIQVPGILADYVTLDQGSGVVHTAPGHGADDFYSGQKYGLEIYAPLDDKEHQLNACEAAVDMLERIDALNKQREIEAQEGGHTYIPLNVGVGLNTGVCVVGNMGSDLRFDYSVLGDSVNLASRLEGQSKEYGFPVIVGSKTALAVKDRFAILELDFIMVKGKKEPEVIYAIAGREDTAHSGRFQRLRNLTIEMLACYRSRDWEGALEAIERGRKTDDAGALELLYNLYEARIRGYQKNPPPEDWNGAFALLTK